MAANLEFQRVNEPAGLRGFANLFRKESRAWWRTRRGWLNALLWPLALGGFVSFITFVVPAVAVRLDDPIVADYGGEVAFGLMMGVSIFFELGIQAVAVGIVILGQDLIIGEVQSGIAEWLLSKPVARRAYILAKLAATLLAVALLLIALPALVGYLIFTIRLGSPYPLTLFLAGVGIMSLHSLFYLTLVILLGSVFKGRGPILGISLGSLLGGVVLGGVIQPLAYVTPWILYKAASLVATGEAVPDGMLTAPLISTAVWCLVFVLVALFKFERVEF
ncbi:MAG: ABC transporter permease subunit [Anaerolineales bacterium]|nr:ABC transporter permease subunit [Anaerolineales bacterium]